MHFSLPQVHSIRWNAIKKNCWTNNNKKTRVLFCCCTIVWPRVIMMTMHNGMLSILAHSLVQFNLFSVHLSDGQTLIPCVCVCVKNWLRHHFSFASEFASNVKSLYSSLFSLIAITSDKRTLSLSAIHCAPIQLNEIQFLFICGAKTHWRKPISITHIESSQQLTCNVYFHTFWCSKTWNEIKCAYSFKIQGRPLQPVNKTVNTC